ncbi:hypothetical protein RYO59_001858 [Thermosynechococcaceae cyanobacterium Okahandja]
MGLSEQEIQQHIAAIDALSNPASPKYGRLLCWQNPWDPVWHYGIGLSDIAIFDTGQRRCPFERPSASVVTGLGEIALPPAKTIGRLKHALWVFADWEYNFLGWNCEHLSRLIATDQPRCYQSRPLWWLANLTPAGEHKTAHHVFQNYLSQVAPELLPS